MRHRQRVLESYEGKTVLITGGTGFIGSNIIEILKKIECRIVLLLRTGEAASMPGCAARTETVGGDIRDPDAWDHAIRAADIVLHLAGQTSSAVANANPNADFDANVLPMMRLLEACRRKGSCPAVVFAGTVTESGMPLRLPVDEDHPDNPLTVYDQHKLMAENHLKHYAHKKFVLGTTLRLANVYGPGPMVGRSDRGILNRIVRRALAGESIDIHGRGDILRDYLYVEDAAYAFLTAGMCAADLSGRHFVISSGRGHTLAESFGLVAERVALKTGRKVTVRHVDPPQIVSPIENRSFVGDPARFSWATGWLATCPLVDGIDRTIEASLCES
ncbi:MAG: NAD-dependent epimerase/dehydratase family protein [Betaproteobacteria bacterium]|nr:NAD-dependent epimerase/dehydratase family protein [Betaproteobacteria bacterium]